MPLWHRYVHYTDQPLSKRRIGIDIVLLATSITLLAATLFWSKESEQQQIARLPSEQESYVEGWQMLKTIGNLFFETTTQETTEKASPASATKERLAGWKIHCGQLYETAQVPYPRRGQADEGTHKGVQKHLLCSDGAKVQTRDINLTTETLTYEVKEQGLEQNYRITSTHPVFLQEGARSLSSLGGGMFEEQGDLHLFQEVLFLAPNLRISAQEQAYGKNMFGKSFLLKQNNRVVVFKHQVAFALTSATLRYRGEAEQADLHLCPSLKTQLCRVFDNNSIEGVVLQGSVVIRQESRSAKKRWTLHAERVALKGDQMRYDTQEGGSSKRVRIVLADDTEILGQRGAHNLVENGGLLCGAVEVHHDKGILKAACLRYRLDERRYRLESSASESELEQRFFAL